MANLSPSDALSIIADLLNNAQGITQSMEAAGKTTLTDEGRDIKLATDIALQEYFDAELAKVGLPIIGEENAERFPTAPSGGYFTVDPLDGSFNYKRGFPYYGCAIAYCEGTRALAGGFLNLGTGELYLGGNGLGATKNGKDIQASNATDTSKSVLATGIPVGMKTDDPAVMTAFAAEIRRWKKVRMIGSAATALALVADGTFDTYFETGIYWWDVAAGLAILEGAGGTISIEGEGLTSGAPLTIWGNPL